MNSEICIRDSIIYHSNTLNAKLKIKYNKKSLKFGKQTFDYKHFNTKHRYLIKISTQMDIILFGW